MKKLVLFFLCLALPLYAQTATQSLAVSGSVPQVLNVSLDTTPVTFVLNELGATVTLPSVTFKSNLKSWVIKVYSVNGSNLKNTDLDLIPYTFALGSLFNGSLLATEPTISQVGYIPMSNKTLKAGDVYPMSITYNSDGGTFWSYDAGNFTDIITIKISVN